MFYINCYINFFYSPLTRVGVGGPHNSFDAPDFFPKRLQLLVFFFWLREGIKPPPPGPNLGEKSLFKNFSFEPVFSAEYFWIPIFFFFRNRLARFCDSFPINQEETITFGTLLITLFLSTFSINRGVEGHNAPPPSPLEFSQNWLKKFYITFI